MIKTIECFKLKQSDSYLSDQIVKVKYLIKRYILNSTYKYDSQCEAEGNN